jgi:hypothetical protein
VNVPVAAAAALVLLTTVIGGASLAGAASAAKDTRKNAYADTLALSQARISAYDAKSNESLTLIARGSGTAFEVAWKASANNTSDQLRAVSDTAPGLGSAWDNYREVHVKIRKSDDGGDWDAAVDKAIGSDSGTSNATFKTFDDQSAGKLADFSDQTRSELTDARDGLPPIGWLGLPLGIAAALLAAWGFSQRLEEYR